MIPLRVQSSKNAELEEVHVGQDEAVNQCSSRTSGFSNKTVDAQDSFTGRAKTKAETAGVPMCPMHATPRQLQLMADHPIFQTAEDDAHWQRPGTAGKPMRILILPAFTSTCNSDVARIEDLLKSSATIVISTNESEGPSLSPYHLHWESHFAAWRGMQQFILLASKLRGCFPKADLQVHLDFFWLQGGDGHCYYDLRYGTYWVHAAQCMVSPTCGVDSVVLPVDANSNAELQPGGSTAGSMDRMLEPLLSSPEKMAEVSIEHVPLERSLLVQGAWRCQGHPCLNERGGTDTHAMRLCEKRPFVCFKSAHRKPREPPKAATSSEPSATDSHQHTPHVAAIAAWKQYGNRPRKCALDRRRFTKDRVVHTSHFGGPTPPIYNAVVERMNRRCPTSEYRYFPTPPPFGHNTCQLNDSSIPPGMEGGIARYNQGGIEGGIARWDRGEIDAGIARYNQGGIEGGIASYNQGGIEGGIARWDRGAVEGGIARYNQGGMEGGIAR